LQIKDFFFREFCRFFRAELESLVSEFKSDCGIEIQKIQREAKRENRLYEITKEVLKEKNHIIVGIDTNKNGDEVLVVQWCFGNNVWFMLYGEKYQTISNHPRIMATIHESYSENIKYIIIDDILVEDNDIGNGSILMPFFLDYCKKTDAQYIHGELSSVDKSHFDRSIHFYEKHGFKCKLNDEKTSGSIHYDLSV